MQTREVSWYAFDTPMGRTFAATSQHGLCRLTWLVPSVEEFELELALLFPDHTIGRGRSGDRVVRQLEEYFAGSRRAFTLDLDLSSLTTFERLVLREACRIPYGATVSYAQLARRIRRPGAARAVGNALRKNPIALIIPCHRVIRSDGSPGGYGGRSAVDHKLTLLRHEAAKAHSN